MKSGQKNWPLTLRRTLRNFDKYAAVPLEKDQTLADKVSSRSFLSKTVLAGQNRIYSLIAKITRQ